MNSGQLIFRTHAIQRMFQRSISIDDVQYVLNNGKIIENYPYDKPYPSKLVLGWCSNRPIHLVIAENSEEMQTIIVTVYEPNHDRWDKSFERRIDK